MSSFDDRQQRGRSKQGLQIKNIAYKLLARWHWIVLGLLCGFALSYYYAWKAVPRYEATATILVKYRSQELSGNGGSANTIDLEAWEAMKTVTESFQLFELYEHLAKSDVVKGSEEFTAEEKADTISLANRLRLGVKVKDRPETRIIDITATNTSAKLAQLIANGVVNSYIEKGKDGRSADVKETIAKLTSQKEGLEKDRDRIRSLIALYAGPKEAEDAWVAKKDAIDDLAPRYGKKHPKMIDAVAGMKLAENKMRAGLLQAIRTSSDTEYWGEYRESLGQLETSEQINEVRMLLLSRRANLNSRQETNDDNLQITNRDLEEKRKAQTFSSSEVALQSRALLPENPVYPNKPRMIIMGAALGFFSGLALSYLFYRLDNKLHTVAEVESEFELPVLASVVNFNEKELAEEESIPEKAHWPPFMVFRGANSSSHYAEMFRVLRASISLLGPAEKRKVTLLSSAMPSEGKTMVTANLAISLAQQGKKVLLVDFDLRKPAQHKMFNVERDAKPGLAELLSGQVSMAEAVTTNIGQENLWVIFSGATVPNPGELLDPQLLTELIDQWRKYFDHIIFDTAPVLSVPDTRLLVPLTDTNCLVVRAHQTPKGAVSRALEVLEDSGVVPDGVVFNGYNEKKLLIGDNYSYGYYQYGKYGKYSYGTYGAVYGKDE